MKRLLYIFFLFLSFATHGQMLINSYQSFPAAGGGGGGSLPTTGLWADWLMSNGITQTSNRVSAIADKNASGHNLSQATGGIQPLWNGTDAVTWSGTRGDQMTISQTLTQPFTLYVVGTISVTTNSDAATFAFDNSGVGNIYIGVGRSGGVNNAFAYGNLFGSSITNSSNIGNGVIYAYKFKYNGASPNSYVRVSSALVSKTTTTGSLGTNTSQSPLVIGYLGTNSTSFTAKEIFIYTGTFDETAVDIYLTATYGVQ